jgi:hypothetical protein
LLHGETFLIVTTGDLEDITCLCRKRAKRFLNQSFVVPLRSTMPLSTTTPLLSMRSCRISIIDVIHLATAAVAMAVRVANEAAAATTAAANGATTK